MAVMFSGTSAGKPTERRSNRLDLTLWCQLLRQVQETLGRNHVSMMSAGVAFYALLSIFPALSALISIYGLIADRGDVQRELDLFAGIRPAEAVKLLADQMSWCTRHRQGLGSGWPSAYRSPCGAR